MKIKEFLTYDQDIFIKWAKRFSSLPSLPSSVASQCLWYSKYIEIDDKIFSVSHYHLLKELIFWVSSFKTINKLKNEMNSEQNFI